MGKSSNNLRLEECSATLFIKSKKFSQYQTQMRKANRILDLVKQMGNKKENAKTTFENASSLMASVTVNGTQCAGGPVPEEARVAYETLQNCSTTARDLCDSNKIPGLDIPLINQCLPLLKTYVDAYLVCRNVADYECSCFTALTELTVTCNFNTLERKTKDARNKCTKPEENGQRIKGSFGDCRKQGRVVFYYAEKCRVCGTSMTTKAPSVITSRLRQLQRLTWMGKN